MSARSGAARNVLTGTLARYLLLLVNIVLGAFLLPFTIRHLGKADYGLWMLAASLTAYLQLLDLGYGNGLVRQLARADARGDEDEMNIVLSTFAVVYTALALAALAGIAVLALAVLPRFPNLSADQVSTGRWLLGILGLRAAAGLPMSVFGAVTTARQRFAATSAIAIGVALVQGLVTWVMLRAGYGLVPLVAATTAVGLASYAAYAAVAWQTFPGMRLSPSRFSAAHVREVTAFSFYLFLIGIAIQVSASVPTLVVGAALGTSAVAVYAVAARMAEYQRQLCGQFSGLLFPVVVRFQASRDRDALRATLVEGTRLALALVVGATVCLLAFGRRIVELWMGPGFEASVWPLYVLAVAGIVVVAQGPTGNILLAAGWHRLVAWASVVEIVLAVGCGLALVRLLGLAGVALGASLPYALLNLGLLMPVACRVVAMPYGALLRAGGGPALLAALPAGALALGLRAAAAPASLGAVLLQVGAVGLLYAAAFWWIGLSAVDRDRYAGTLRELVARRLQPQMVAS
ncbi:MAG TPA: oligosaccharide flippase family protein [Vicinamibacterales bacterium]|nr:oligosaccharide flippase family protein [Vicinamibacterales bacterium]